MIGFLKSELFFFLRFFILKGGVDNGLAITLDTQQDDYMPVWEESDEVFLETGFKVQIHDKGDPPFIHELGFGVSPGFQTLVATQEQRIKFLPEPFGDCLQKSNIPKDQRLFYDDYTISGCRITCETLYMQKQCGCRMVHMPGNGTVCTKALISTKVKQMVQNTNDTKAVQTDTNIQKYKRVLCFVFTQKHQR